MRVRELQERAAKFLQGHGLEATPEVRVLDLVSEVGEVAKEVLRSTGYGRVPFRPGKGWAEEVGDALFALVCVANAGGVDLEACFEGALKKYAARLEAHEDPGSVGGR
jgi:NTP pyrophosphatase (non-canonical NTP hydrolase)